MIVGPIVPEHRQTANKRIAAYLICASFLFLAALLFSFHGGLQGPKNIPAERGISAVPTEIQPKLLASYGKLPLGFEANRGQARGPVKFLSRGRGYTIFLTHDEAVLTLRKSSVVSGQSSVGTRQNPSVAPTFGSARGGVAQHPPFGAEALPDPLPLAGPEKTSDNEVEKPRDRRAGPALPFSSRGLADTGESSAVVRMKLVGANAKAAVTGAEELPGKSNYFIGNDPKKWRTNVPTYAKVRYENVYPGVDLVYYGNQGGQLEYDFVVAPGADPAAIRLALSGGLEVGSRQSAVGTGTQNRQQRQSKTQNLKSKIDPNGDLMVKTDGDEVRFQKPVAYQPPINNGQRTTDDGQRTPVDAHYVLQASNQVGFKVGPYDRTRPLFIDPVLSYSTYLGGSSGDYGAGIAVDSSGNAYVTGVTESTDFPTFNPIQGTCNGCFYGSPHSYSGNAFVAKLNPTGSALVYSTYLGGGGGGGFEEGDWGDGIAVDSAGNAYVTGFTESSDFPTVNPLQATCVLLPTEFIGLEACSTAFVAKLNPAGNALVYSTYLGGNGGDGGYGIAADSAGNAYVTGYTGSTDFPIANPLQPSYGGGQDAFVAKLNPAGSALVYSTYLGGSGEDYAQGIAVDAAGNAYVTGITASINFPAATPPTICGNCGSNNNGAFVAKLNPAGSALVYVTLLGPATPSSVAVDPAGNAYVTGSTDSTDLPTVNPFQTTCGPCSQGNQTSFVAKLNAAGSALVYSTYLGGSGGDARDQGDGIAADSSGNAYVTGVTSSPDFPTANPLQSCVGGGAFVTKFNPAGSALVYSTCLQGGWGSGIALDASGNAYVTGSTSSTHFVTVNPLQPSYGGGTEDAFVAKLGAVTLSPTSLSFSNQVIGTTSPAQPVTLSNMGNASLTISSIAMAGSNSGDFAVAATGTTCSTSAALAAGTSCTINVTFAPTIVGSESASLSVSDNIAGAPLTVPLSGAGVLLPAPNVSPTSLSFNNQAVGTTSTPQPVTVTNTGPVALTIGSLTISSGWTQSNNCLPSVASSASCTINVSFQPTAPGSQTGALTLTDNASNSPQTVTLSGTGLGPTASLSASSLTFVSQQVGTTSSSQPVTLSNTGYTALAITNIATSTNFAQTNNCGASVAVGGSCTINVTFSPTAGGPLAGTLTITDNSNGAAGSTQSVALSGTGQDFTVVAPFGSPTSATVAPGQPATYTLSVAGEGGFNQSVSFTCTGAPSEATCTVSPSTLTPGSSAVNIAVNVTTTAPSVSAPRSRPLPPVPPLSPGLRGLLMLALALTAMAWAMGRRKQLGVSRRQSIMVLLASGLLLALALAGCGGSSVSTPPPNLGTPAGTYTLTVTGSAGSGSSALSHSVTLTLTVS
jgi:hypothetical protein